MTVGGGGGGDNGGGLAIIWLCILSVLSYFLLVGCKDVDYSSHTIFCVLVTSTNIQYTGTIPQRENYIVSKYKLNRNVFTI